MSAIQPKDALVEDPMLTLAQVEQLAGIGKTKIYELMKQGRFPAARKPGGVSSRWIMSEVLEWRRNLPTYRDAA